VTSAFRSGQSEAVLLLSADAVEKSALLRV
jgi:hypothetical protein